MKLNRLCGLNYGKRIYELKKKYPELRVKDIGLRLGLSASSAYEYLRRYKLDNGIRERIKKGGKWFV